MRRGYTSNMVTFKSSIVYICTLFQVIFAKNETSSSTEEGNSRLSGSNLGTYLLYGSLTFCLIMLFCCLYDSCCPRKKKSTEKTQEDVNTPCEDRNSEVDYNGHISPFVISTTTSNSLQIDDAVAPPTYIEVTLNMDKYMISQPRQCTSSL